MSSSPRVLVDALRRNLPALGLLVLLGYLVVVPLALLLVASFKPTGLPLDPGWSLQSYIDVYGDAGFYRITLTTLKFALGCTASALTRPLTGKLPEAVPLATGAGPSSVHVV